MKRKILAIFSSVLVLSILMCTATGCSKQKVSAGKDEVSTSSAKAKDNKASISKFVKISVVMPGEASPRMKEFVPKEFNTKLKEDLNCELDLSYSPWAQYYEKIDLMLASKEQLEFYWHGYPFYPNFVARKTTYELDNLLNQYGQNILKAIPKENFESMRINGKIYGIPSAYAPSASKFGSVCVRQDLLEDVGMKKIESIKDLEEFGSKLKGKHPDITLSSFQGFKLAFPRELQGNKNYTILNYDIIFDEDEKKVLGSLYESQLFKDLCNTNRRWVKQGFVSEESLTDPNNHGGRFSTGKYAIAEGPIAGPVEKIDTVLKNDSNARLEEYIISPQKTKYILWPGNEVLMIAAHTKIPERVIMFFDWIWSCQENYDFTLLGVKGKDYEITKTGRVKRLNNDTLFYEWMFRNINYMKFPETVSDNFIENYKNWDKQNSKYSALFGFSFNKEAIKSEYAQMETVSQTNITPMVFGFVDYDEKYKEALAELKKAGLDKYVNEVTKQVNAFLSSKK